MTGRADSLSRQRGLYAVVGALLLALAAACSSAASTTPAPSATGAAPASTSTSSTADRGVEAVAAYQGMWGDFVQAGTTSDWKSPGLKLHATGVALTNMSRALYADHLNGFVTKGTPRFDPHVQSVDPASGSATKVVVGDCADSTSWLKYHADSGKPVGGGGGRSRITGVVERQSDGSWKVTDYAVQDVGSC